MKTVINSKHQSQEQRFSSGSKKKEQVRKIAPQPQSYCKLNISTAPTKAKTWEPAYSQVLIQNKIDRQRVKTQRVRQADRRLWSMVFGVETRREIWERR